MTVPATTVVRVDRRGRIVEAWTNTGCAPGLADDTWVQLRGREGLEPATAALEARLAAVKWTGAWLPGQWHRPPPEGH